MKSEGAAYVKSINFGPGLGLRVEGPSDLPEAFLSDEGLPRTGTLVGCRHLSLHLLTG
ncbi:MAG: hypothetical protein M1297_04000 [Nitrospirae bacterium]|nr:hypothetical protein [Nitrospirota bacterium]